NPVLCAPGVDIISARKGGGLTAMSVTSMACPHVAGLAALWWQWAAQNQGQATGRNVRARVLASATTIGFVPGVAFSDRGNGYPIAPN
ncbi:S8 family serine peptidase, partial [Rhizobium ruizarguesonis]